MEYGKCSECGKKDFLCGGVCAGCYEFDSSDYVTVTPSAKDKQIEALKKENALLKEQYNELKSALLNIDVMTSKVLKLMKIRGVE